MRLIAEIPQRTKNCAGNWYVYRDDEYVYVQMPAGFGAKIKVGGGLSDEKCKHIASEITDRSEKAANNIVYNTDWVWWDYYGDHNFSKANCKKAPVT